MTLIVNEVSKKFGKHLAVDHLQLTVAKGQIFGLLGANGAGKTTTIRMILGILEPSEGTISWNGESIGYHNSSQIGYLPEERGLYPKLTVSDQIHYLGELRGMGKKEIANELKYWLSKFHIEEYANKKLEELSKGNQQKVQFIAAVINRPQLLFLDEPFSGLDPVNAELLKETVVDLARGGTTIIFSSHRMEHVEELCENICILDKGKTVLKGNLKQIKRDFGKSNLIIHTEADLDDLIQIDGVAKMKKTVQGYQIQVAREAVSQQILKEIVQRGYIRHFSLEEPSLQEIFIEKVGGRVE